MRMQIHALSPQNYICCPPNSSFAPPTPTSLSSTLQFTKLLGSQRKGSSRLQTGSRRYRSLVRPVRVICGMMQVDGIDDGFYIRRCVELARRAIGRTSPNPMVGCVIVKDGKIVGEGFHPKAGQPHAEVFALRDAGDLAENATAYVSLEPCNHYGRTPPCTEALIKAKVKRVVVGMVDPNPIVASKGLARLRSTGIDVTVGVEEELCKMLNEAWIHQMLSGKPFVTLRYTLSVNGHFSDMLGEGATESGGYYSQLLQAYDAILHSASLIEEFPCLTSQEPGANQPLQIIIASTPCSPIQLPGLTEERASKTIIFTDQETTVEAKTTQKGVKTVVLDTINLTSILEECKSRGLCSVLLDLRGNFADLEGLLREAVVQNVLRKIVIEVLPQWNESETRNHLMSLSTEVKRLEVKNLQSKASGRSIVLEGYL